MLMDIKHTNQGSVTIVSITGSLDALTAPDLTNDLTQTLAGGQHQLVVDLAGMEYTSSAGLRVLLNAVKDARGRGGDLRVAAVRPTVNKVFEMSGFTSILKFYPDVNSAVKSFS
jgi:anti-anti-sigma factor